MYKRSRRTHKQDLSAEDAAHEIYAVLLLGQKASRALPKDFLRECLKSQDVYVFFLKLCMEYDFSGDLSSLRKGLLLVVKTLGAAKIAKAAKINRVTLYRMLGKGGNPGIKNLMSLLKVLGVSFWIVDKEFYDHREQARRRGLHRAGT